MRAREPARVVEALGKCAGAPASTAPDAIAARSARRLHGDQPEIGRLRGAGPALEREVEALTFDHWTTAALRSEPRAFGVQGAPRRQQPAHRVGEHAVAGVDALFRSQMVHTVGGAAELVAVLECRRGSA